MSKRKVVDARQDQESNISHVRLDGNHNFTPIDKAIEMGKQNKLENAHTVTKKDGTEYLRSNPDSRSGNNLDEMAQD